MRFVRGIARFARWLAYACAIGALLIAFALREEEWWFVFGLAAAVPAVILWLFSLAVLELAELPQRLRNAPAQPGEVRRALDELSRARGTRLGSALWRVGRVAADTRALATPWVPIVPLVSPPFLLATLASALATPFLVLLALVLLVVA